MTVDTRGLNHQHVGKRMRIELEGGDSLEVRLHELTVCARLEPCCGITYILLSSSGKRDVGAAYWTPFSDIEKFEVFGD